MRLPFCDHHICAFLESWQKSPKPLDIALNHYFRTHKSIGAHDRRIIGEVIYGFIRWKSLVDYFSPTPHPLDLLKTFRNLDLAACQKDPSLPLSVRLGMPPFLSERFVAIYGPEKGEKLCHILNTAAPTTIRVNLLKTTRDALLERWQGKYAPAPTLTSPVGLQFAKRTALFSLPEFKEGLFEMQDEGSQCIAALVQAKPGDHVLDYCSGSGGKTLAFAPALKGKGQIYLHDNRPWILQEARQRLRRAGVQNAQFTLPKKPVDWLLLDVPCSGTGTLRRNPDAKWKIDKALVDRLILEQREILIAALPYLKPDGHLVYATCSLLPEENEEQVTHFLQQHPLQLEQQVLYLPEEGGRDGFFAAVFKKRPLI